MNNTLFHPGTLIRLTATARWRNYGDPEPRTMPTGATMRLESWRPEGWQAVEIVEQPDGQFIVGGFFFLFNRYLQTAEVIG